MALGSILISSGSSGSSGGKSTITNNQPSGEADLTAGDNTVTFSPAIDDITNYIIQITEWNGVNIGKATLATTTTFTIQALEATTISYSVIPKSS
jgi:hypothetical protein